MGLLIPRRPIIDKFFYMESRIVIAKFQLLPSIRLQYEQYRQGVQNLMWWLLAPCRTVTPKLLCLPQVLENVKQFAKL